MRVVCATEIDALNEAPATTTVLYMAIGQLTERIRYPVCVCTTYTVQRVDVQMVHIFIVDICDVCVYKYGRETAQLSSPEQ